MFTAAGVAVLASVPAPAAAQRDPQIVLDIMVECSKIEDVMARVACYDTNIRSAAGTAETAPPRQNAIPQPASAPVPTADATGVGRANAPSPPRPAAPAAEPARQAHTVAAVVDRGPGAYLLTLEDGAQWEFAQTMGLSYRAPERGSTVEIERGSLGGYRMRFDGQRPVRVRRVR
jgi:predicted component of type VI protein secretion system